jgi:hypothetical protein
VFVEVSQLAIIEVDLLMKITQEVFIARGSNFVHETSTERRERAVSMTALLNLLFAT